MTMDLLSELEAAFYEEAEVEEEEDATKAATAGRGTRSKTTSLPTHRAQASLLTGLSEELLLRVLGRLAPDDLLVLAQTSRYLHTVICQSNASLWRKHYLARWPDGPPGEDAEHVQGLSWKVLYMERDHQAVLEARQSAPAEALYVQMATARRSEALSRADGEALFLSPTHNRSLQLSSEVDAFRRARGLTDTLQHATHSCRGGCSWSHLVGHSAWICEKSGFVHVCTSADSCAFRELDPSSDMQVCTISGRCFANMLTEREEHAGEWERGQSRAEQQGEEDGWGAESGVGGRLGRAFLAGYNVETAEEFEQMFQVRF